MKINFTVENYKEFLPLQKLYKKFSIMAGQENYEYTLVGSAETDPATGKISIDSPLGRALIGRSQGEKISLDTISGPIEYTIQEIK